MNLEKINPLEFFSKYLKLKQLSDDEYRALCPFHKDESIPNLTINVRKGVYYCFSCHTSGNMVDFYKSHTGKSARDFAIEYGIESPKIDIESCSKALEDYPDIINYFLSNRGIKLETLKKFKIGYNGDRITIPIYDKDGILVNVRKYKIGADGEIPKMINEKGFGKATIFPEKNLSATNLILCAGEWDCILLNQYGLNAITVTAGEGTWNDNFQIGNKNIYIVYDCDKAGIEGAERISKILLLDNKVKVVNLGLENKEDITDWFVKYKKTKEELLTLIKGTVWSTLKNNDYFPTTLKDASRADNYNKMICFKGLVVGMREEPYQIPSSVTIKCDFKSERSALCPLCSINKEVKKIDITNKEDLIEFIDMNNFQILGHIKKIVGIPSRCSKYTIIEQKKRNVEEISISPEMNFSNDENQYIVRRIYYLGEGATPNNVYIFYGTTAPDPKNQKVIHIVDKMEKTSNNIDEFKLTDEIKESLDIFRVNPGQTIQQKLDEIYNDLIHNVTKMYKREQLCLAFDLVWHSVLHFTFLGNSVDKGWCEAFVLGDSGTGKSLTVERLIKHYKCGERISAENTSIAGLVAGVDNSGGKYTMLLGKIPLSDRGGIVIDECGKYKHEDFAVLSDIRSSGTVEIYKILKLRTKARVRFIFIANPNKRLIEYSYGVTALKDIIGQNEDIRRLDFAISVGDVDITNDVFNARHTDDVKHIYTSESCYNLLMFAWSRKNEHIKFTKKAEDRILEVASEFSLTFSKVIPLVQASEIRIKIAKLCVSLAVRLYNTDDTGEVVIVDIDHVETIRKVLLEMYSRPGMDYFSYSQQREKETEMTNTEYIKKIFNGDINLIDMILDNKQFGISDFENFFNIDKAEAKKIIINLLRIRALKKHYAFYEKTSSFIRYLKEYKAELESSQLNII